MRNPFRKQSKNTNDLQDSQEIGEEHDETEQQEKPNRITWNRQVEFLLTLIGYSVGFGNLWRFPYICMRNGGGAFLIPYFLFLFVCAIPLFYLEVAISQFSSRSVICVWVIIPLFKGIGWGMVVVNVILCVYYNVILAWIVFYLVSSFTAVLPWSNCNNSWNTPGCSNLGNITVNNCSTSMYTAACSSSINLTTDMAFDLNSTDMYGSRNLENDSGIYNTTGDIITTKIWRKLTPAEEFWQFEVLQLTDGIDNPGSIRWQLLLCLMSAWLLVFLCLCKGIKTSGKVVYFTATAPYAFLTILLVRGLLLPGAIDGIKFYIIPDFNQLANIKVWGEACLQIFYSLGACWGGIQTMASYNKFHQNCLRNSIVVACCSSASSFYAGFVVFSIIGFMAREANMAVSEVVQSGPGLVFIAYPDGLSRLPVAPVWSVMFFVMLILIGLDSQFTQVEMVVSCLMDRFPTCMYFKRTTLFTAGLCLVWTILGVPMITQGGMYFFQIVDWYLAAFCVVTFGFIECIGLSYIYGLSRIEHDIKMMLGHGVNMFWKICWAFITPLCLFCIIIFTIFAWQPPVYGDYHYPAWAISMGWLIALSSIVPVPLVAILGIIREKGSFLQRIKKLLRPANDWGPALPKNRVGSKYYMTEQHDQGQTIPLQTI